MQNFSPDLRGSLVTTHVTADCGPVWVGLLDMDEAGPVAGMSGPPRAEHGQARILVRIHGVPIGFVKISVKPEDSLTARARSAAEVTLADVLTQHAELDKECDRQRGRTTWQGQMSCLARFPTHSDVGISVVVCTRDRPAMLRESLQSLQRMAYSPLEILVVDNAPTDGATRAVVEELAAGDPRFRYTCEPHPGKSLALNHGLAAASYDLVATTDDDVLVDPRWLSAISAAFAADPETICVTGMVASSALNTQSERYFDARYSWGEGFQPRQYDLVGHRHPSRLYPFSAGVFGTGANCAFRRSAVVQLGGFDPLLGAGSPRRGGADLDMFVRVILAGGRISYLPSALVWHRHRSDTQALAKQIYAYGHGLGAYLAKHFPNPQLRGALVSRGLHLVGTALRRQRMAAHASHMGFGGQQFALYEICGIIPGAIRYWIAARRPTTPFGDPH